MTDNWPQVDSRYERPRDTEDNQHRWQQALDKALATRKLRLERTGTRNVYDLEGECPRCGHATSQEVWVEVIQDWTEEDAPGPADNFDDLGERRDLGLFPHRRPGHESATINFDCVCDHTHDGGEKGQGCGWGGPLSVNLQVPAGGQS